MDKDIPHTDSIGKREVRVLLPEFLGQLCHRLAHDFELSLYRSSRLLVCLKSVIRHPIRELLNILDCLTNMPKVDSIMTRHTATALRQGLRLGSRD